jgi:TRAP-type C4-dicarboxylate transport system permease small subunit
MNAPLRSWWSRLATFVERLETFLIVTLLGGLVLLASSQIVLRNFFSIGVTWGDGLSRLAVLWLALIGALAAARSDRHIHMELVARFLSPRLKRATAFAMDLFTALIAGLLAWYSASFVRDSREFGDLLLDGVPAWWLQLIMPIVFVLISYRYVVHAARQLKAD